MKTTGKIAFGLLIGCLGTPLLSRAQFDGDVRVWQEMMFREYTGERFQAYTWAELRHFDDASRLGLWLVQQKFYYSIGANWSVGSGPAWIESRGSDGVWNTLLRWEFEVNPTIKLGDGSSIQFRNRLEARWWESRDYDIEFVSRHRIRYSKSADWLPRMKRLEISNEFFFDYRTGSYSENRLRLYDVHFDAFGSTSANTFFQIRSRRPGGRGSWQHAYIIGFGFRFLP